MSSTALLCWHADRMVRLNEIETQCAATVALIPPNPNLADENLRGYVMLLSAHFQGFCRDLHSECVQAVAAATIPTMRSMIQGQCVAGRQIDGANPRYATLRKDFERFGLDLTARLSADPANQIRITHVDHLNSWRNYAAHHLTSVPAQGGPFLVGTVASWKISCDGLAVELDRIMYNELQALTGMNPW